MKSSIGICVVLSTVLVLGTSTPYNHPQNSRFHREQWGRNQPEVQHQFYPPPIHEWPTRNYHPLPAPAYSRPEVAYPETQSYPVNHNAFTSATNLASAANYLAQEVNHSPVNYQAQEGVNHSPASHPVQRVNDSPIKYRAQEGVDHYPGIYPAQEEVKHLPVIYLAQADKNLSPSNSSAQGVNDSPVNYFAQEEDNYPPDKNLDQEEVKRSPDIYIAQEAVNNSPINYPVQGVNSYPIKYQPQERFNDYPVKYQAQEKVNHSPVNYLAREEFIQSPVHYLTQERVKHSPVNHHAHENVNHSPIIIKKLSVPMVEGGAKYIFSEDGTLTNFRIIRWNATGGTYNDEDYIRVAVKDALARRGVLADNNDQTKSEGKTLATPYNAKIVDTVIADSDDNIAPKRANKPKPRSKVPQPVVSNVLAKPAKFNSAHSMHKVHKHPVKVSKITAVTPVIDHNRLTTTTVIAKSDSAKVVAIGDNVKAVAISSSGKEKAVAVASSGKHQPVVTSNSVKSQTLVKLTPPPVNNIPTPVKYKPMPVKSTRTLVKHTPVSVKPTPATVISTESLISVHHKQPIKNVHALLEHSKAKELAHSHLKKHVTDDLTVTSSNTKAVAVDDTEKTTADSPTAPDDVLIAQNSTKSLQTADGFNTKVAKITSNNNGDNYSQSDSHTQTPSEKSLASRSKLADDAKPDSAYKIYDVLTTNKITDHTEKYTAGDDLASTDVRNENLVKNDSNDNKKVTAEVFSIDKISSNTADKSVVEIGSDKEVANTNTVTDTLDQKHIDDDTAYSDEQYDTAESDLEETDENRCTDATGTYTTNIDVKPDDLMVNDDTRERPTDKSAKYLLKTDESSPVADEVDKKQSGVKLKDNKTVKKPGKIDRKNEKPLTKNKETKETVAKNTNATNINVKPSNSAAYIQEENFEKDILKTDKLGNKHAEVTQNETKTTDKPEKIDKTYDKSDTKHTEMEEKDLSKTDEVLSVTDKYYIVELKESKTVNKLDRTDTKKDENIKDKLGNKHAEVTQEEFKTADEPEKPDKTNDKSDTKHKEMEEKDVSKTDEILSVADKHYIVEPKETKTVNKLEKTEIKNDKNITQHKETNTVAALEAENKQAEPDKGIDPTKADSEKEAKLINSEEVLVITNKDVARIGSENDEPLDTVSFLASLISKTLKGDGSLQKWLAEPKIQAFVKKIFPML